MKRVYLGVGSNYEPQKNLRAGIRLLREHDAIKFVAASNVYQTEPVKFADAKPYLNAVFAIETDLVPDKLKAALIDLEDKTKRVRHDATGNKSKVVSLDLDILLYADDAVGGYKFNGKDYVLPHEAILEVAYAAVPLADLVPQWVHPKAQKSMREIAASLSQDGLQLIAEIDLNTEQ